MTPPPADGLGGRPSRRSGSETPGAPTAPRLWIDDPAVGEPTATLLLAHGAGAGAEHPFMVQAARELAQRRLRVVRFEFGYMATRRADGGRRPPAPMATLVDDFRAAALAAPCAGPLFVGGKSMGGRVACRVAASLGARGVALLGFPFHPMGRPDRPRLEEFELRGELPVWVGQGERDPMGDRGFVEALHWKRAKVELHWIADADHSWEGPARRASGLLAARTRAWDALARFCGA